jgi:hypothetical protein
MINFRKLNKYKYQLKENIEPSLVHDALTQLWENKKLTDYQYQLANDFFRWHFMRCTFLI